MGYSMFARILAEAKKLQVVFFRACNLTDKDLKHIVMTLKPDTALAQARNLKVLDLSSNKFSGEICQEFKAVFL